MSASLMCHGKLMGVSWGEIRAILAARGLFPLAGIFNIFTLIVKWHNCSIATGRKPVPGDTAGAEHMFEQNAFLFI